MSFLRAYSKHLPKACLPVLGLILLTLFAGCGSDETPQQSSPQPAKTSQSVQKQPAQTSLNGLPPSILHETGIETYRLGLSSENPGTVAQGIAMLEEAIFADPDNTTLWLDLADAYINSDLFIEYPYAIDIYWLLLDDDEIPHDYLYARLAEAYAKMGDTQSAFEIGLKRVNNARGDDINPAALHLAFLALANDSFSEAAEGLKTKANSVDEPGYLLLLASTLQEAAGDKQAAIDLIDQALPSLKGNATATEMVQRERGRLVQ